ncbi:MaoC/PaaZ C-terminal domain-containing protein [Streptomyces sp. PTD5-9]|uniref:MaoC/PaaZ C-terminal domain-containing protein n=1 Tax=Streptomyces sp. PTD5-9 TaxID=3120150 RepID=UPI00300914D5
MPNPDLTLLRAAVTSPFRKAGRPGAVLPTGRSVLPPAPIAPGPLAAYRRICGFPDAATLPLTYPHVRGFPLAMRLMTARGFPLPVVGLVHTWIEITRHRPPLTTDLLELTVYADGLSPHRRGTEVTVVTEARRAGELIWESRSGYLSRHAPNPGPTSNSHHTPNPRPAERDTPPAADGTVTDRTAADRTAAPATEGTPDARIADTSGEAPDTTAAGAADGPPAVDEWRLPGDLGRRYGAASGDRNPIHLYPLTARLFGFPRPIAHGMWTVARCLAEAPDPEGIQRVRAVFRAPVPLPSTVAHAADANGFRLYGADGRVHLIGTTTRAPGPRTA